MRFLLLFCLPLNLWAQTVVYTTDLEGHAARWNEFKARCEGFRTDANGEAEILPGFHYVYGGDILDREPGHLYLIKEHLGLALRQPTQVDLITGNRDLNKLPIEFYGREKEPRLLEEYLQEIAAPHLLENQRLELISRGEPATYADSIRGLTDLILPGGNLRRYLQLSRPAKIIGDTLFVHGAWKSELPVRETVETLNSEFKSDINDWAETRDIRRPAALEKLMFYQSYKGGVIYGDHSDRKWNPTLPDQAVRQAVRDSGIHRVVLGHRSYGDTPAVLRDGDLEFIFADNSGSSRSGANIVTLMPGQTRIQSRLSNGTELDYTWMLGDPSDPIGHWTKDGALIVGRTKNNDWVLFKNPGGRNFVLAKDSLRRDGSEFQIVYEARTIHERFFDSALGDRNDRRRVDTFKTWHGADLSPEQVRELVRRAKSLDNSFEIGQYIRLALENGSEAWLPALARWRAAWSPATARWQSYLLVSLEEAVSHIKCANALSLSREFPDTPNP